MINYLSDIITHIKKLHPWFDEVAGPAWVDDFTGRLLYGENNDYKETGIDDRLGNYAYIRTAGVISYQRPFNRATDCLPQSSKSLPATLVAVLYDGEPYKMESTLHDTLLTWGKDGAFITLSNSQVITNLAVLDEYAAAGKEVQEEALQRIGRYTVVSINFTVNLQQVVMMSTCPCNPCKSC